MKKLLLALSVFCMHYNVCAQYDFVHDIVTDDVVGLMRKHLFHVWETSEVICVGNMLSWTEAWSSKSDLNGFIQKEDIGVFCFRFWGLNELDHLLLKSGDNYEVLPLFDGTYKDVEVNYLWILNKVTDYFKRHPEIDDRLYPYYIAEISNIYSFGTYNLGGGWTNWHGGEFADHDFPEKHKY